MQDKIKLQLIGITYNQIESGVYAVILRQEGGNRRIPIVIGSTEAQSIECKLQDVVTPRPLTHDLLVNIMRAYGLNLKEILLRRMPNGVFAADLCLTDGEREITIDSRSSDAIAIAVRLGAPIYTTQDVLDQAGFDPEKDKRVQVEQRGSSSKPMSGDLAMLSIKDLEAAMEKAVQSENYEEAARIKQEIEKRK